MIASMTLAASCRRAVVSCCPEPANVKVDKSTVSKAMAYFFKEHFLFYPPVFVDFVRARSAR